MAKMTPQKHNIEKFNGGTGDDYSTQQSNADDFTMVVENSTYSAEVVDNLANNGVDNTEANQIGTALVVCYNYNRKVIFTKCSCYIWETT